MTTRRGAAGGGAARAAIVLLVAGCTPKPAEPLPPQPRIAHPVPARAPISNPLLIRAPHPDVAFPDIVPDLAEEPRWPLTGMQHPALQPSFDVADALAEPGITWTDLCARSVDRRRDLSHRDELVYLGAWCAAKRHDPAAAVALLAQVWSSPVPGVAHGVPFDIANILVDSEDAEHADQILEHAQLRAAPLYDVLAAAYFEIGRMDDALQATAAALQLDDHRDAGATCHRLARSALLSPKAARAILVDELASAAHRKSPDPVCVELAADVACVVDLGPRCSDYHSIHHLDAGELQLARLAQRWDVARSWSDWLTVAENIHNMLVRSQSDEMFHGALDAAVVASECDPHALQMIATRIAGMGAGRSLDSHAAWLGSLSQKLDDCAAFRARWLLDHPQ